MPSGQKAAAWSLAIIPDQCPGSLQAMSQQQLYELTRALLHTEVPKVTVIPISMPSLADAIQQYQAPQATPFSPVRENAEGPPDERALSPNSSWRARRYQDRQKHVQCSENQPRQPGGEAMLHLPRRPPVAVKLLTDLTPLQRNNTWENRPQGPLRSKVQNKQLSRENAQNTYENHREQLNLDDAWKACQQCLPSHEVQKQPLWRNDAWAAHPVDRQPPPPNQDILKQLRPNDPPPSDQKEYSMKAKLQLLAREDPDAVVVARGISKLGFSSGAILQEYFDTFGTVKQVFVSHARVKSSRHARSSTYRLRAATQGFILMESAQVARRILDAPGGSHDINGSIVQVSHFVRTETPAEAEVDEVLLEDADEGHSLVQKLSDELLMADEVMGA